MISEKRMQVRMVLAGTFVLLLMGGLIGRLAMLHLFTREETRQSLDRHRQMEKKLAGVRGTIHDRNGEANILAMNLAVKDICIDPGFLIKSNLFENTVNQLARQLELPEEDLLTRLDRPNKRFAYVQRLVKEDKAAEIAALKLPGVFFQENAMRYYPQESFMCHVVGFVNHDGVGSAGVELLFNRHLQAKDGLLESYVNGSQQRQEIYAYRERYIPAEDGGVVTLNLDQNIQYIVEKALDEAMEKNNARAAWAIVQRVKTGEIMAMAARPAYDPNRFNSALKDATLNRCIGNTYEPGSTFKAVVFSATLNDAKVTPDTLIDCEMSSWFYAGKILRDYHPAGILTVADGLKKSSNIMSAKLSLMLGSQRFYEYLKAYHIGDKAGIDLPGEEGGILNPLNRWYPISPTRIAIGQGVAVTALQLLNVYCTIANDGYMMKPYVVNRVESNGGRLVQQQRPEVIGQPITVETARTMKYMLGRVTEEGGTGTRAAIEGYKVAGKTGTAQKAVAGGYSSSQYVASFVGFIPADHPELGIIVVVDEPQPVHTGGAVAGPVFSRIASQTVRYLDIPPTELTVGSKLASRR